MGAEGQPKLVRDLRPELAHHVPSHVGANAPAYARSIGPESPWIAGMIKIADGFGADGRRPFGEIEHASPGIRAGDPAVAQGVSETRREAALALPVVARILVENRWVQEDTEEVAGCAVSQGRGITLFESHSTLPECSVLMIDMGFSGVNVGPEKVDGIYLLIQEQMEFSGGIECARLESVAMPGHVDRGPFYPFGEASHQWTKGSAIIFHREGFRGRRAGRDLHL